MLCWAVRAVLADARVTQARVAVAPGDTQAQVLLADIPRALCRPCGGSTRARTVLAALRDAALTDDTWVLVHDAARPGLPAAALTRLLDICLACGRGGLLALPVSDTVKRGMQIAQVEQIEQAVQAVPAAPACVAATVPRENLWLAQTPQVFRAGALQRALQAALDAGMEPGDEAGAMEMLGEAPLLVPGSPRNLKVTWPEDFAWMQTWL